jgi:hypothetical protein
MRLFSVLVAVCASTLAVGGPIVNGDFQTGDLTGWTVFTIGGGTTGTGFPAVASFDTTGGGATLAAKFDVGGPSGTGSPQGGGGIFQVISLAAGLVNIHTDFASDYHFSSSNADAGTFQILWNGASIYSSSLGSINNQTLRRVRFHHCR